MVRIEWLEMQLVVMISVVRWSSGHSSINIPPRLLLLPTWKLVVIGSSILKALRLLLTAQSLAG